MPPSDVVVHNMFAISTAIVISFFVILLTAGICWRKEGDNNVLAGVCIAFMLATSIYVSSLAVCSSTTLEHSHKFGIAMGVIMGVLGLVFLVTLLVKVCKG